MRNRTIVLIAAAGIGTALTVSWTWTTKSRADSPRQSRAVEQIPMPPPPDAASNAATMSNENTAGASAPRYSVTIRTPAPSPGVTTGLIDGQGRLVTVPCATCHSMVEPPPPASALGLQSLKNFHKGLVLEHGKLTCASCHNPEDSRTYRLADGTVVEGWDVMELCSQCHGPQRTDYDHGAHGGMTGYWDLAAGPRTRNSCTSCHSPHEPAFGPMRPTFKPIDRFLLDRDHHEGSPEDMTRE
ncbi:MAG: hypothetical protein KC729_01270 [Candidatus Eisenbacteria bacterium]|uniref:Cytochrome c7-like domain-containing protein n=1 Tax=Eiseniibacteriota bacterium TaxID=2212470 RepID=A0A956RMQ0_UNCEI|nr:hypothetical protein [Candidatus Eisenbacteria bacterium]